MVLIPLEVVHANRIIFKASIYRNVINLEANHHNTKVTTKEILEGIV